MKDVVGTVLAALIVLGVAVALFIGGFLLVQIRNSRIDQEIKDCIANGGKPYTSGSGGHVTCVEN